MIVVAAEPVLYGWRWLLKSEDGSVLAEGRRPFMTQGSAEAAGVRQLSAYHALATNRRLKGEE